jgi:hypothetical protein
MLWCVNPDEDNHQLESRVRENRTHGSEGGEGESPSRPLTTRDYVKSHEVTSNLSRSGQLAAAT